MCQWATSLTAHRVISMVHTFVTFSVTDMAAIFFVVCCMWAWWVWAEGTGGGATWGWGRDTYVHAHTVHVHTTVPMHVTYTCMYRIYPWPAGDMNRCIPRERSVLE